jgi:ribonuclease T2
MRTCLVALASLLGSARAVPRNSVNALNATGARCVPTEPCWPTPAEVEELRAALDPGEQRSLRWDGCPVLQDEALCDTDVARRAFPLTSAVPAFSPWLQPLFGLASYGDFGPLEPLFVRDQDSDSGCFTGLVEDRDECFAQTRNNAMLGWEPAFTVFATTAAHVRTAVQFAVRHNLCIMVAGTGHDFINRHSCDNGIFIRTTMIKGQEWNPNDPRWADGSVRLGAGVSTNPTCYLVPRNSTGTSPFLCGSSHAALILPQNTFHEVQKAAAERGRYVSAGWAISVGVVGWSIGGGHGPFAPSKGMGVDNILEVEIVTATGELIVANEMQNTDLWWAVRGGGGSTWGVITSITLRTHATPDGGFVRGGIQWSGGMCSTGADGRGRLHNLIDGLNDWAVARDEKWSGLTFLTLVRHTPHRHRQLLTHEPCILPAISCLVSAFRC